MNDKDVVRYTVPSISKPQLAQGSVYDQLSAKIAEAAESAMTKSKVDDLTEFETVALCVISGCEMIIEPRIGDNYGIKPKNPIAIAIVDGKFTVHEQRS